MSLTEERSKPNRPGRRVNLAKSLPRILHNLVERAVIDLEPAVNA